MSDEPDEATIERRSQNAETAMTGLGKAAGCAWAVSSFVLVAIPMVMLLG